VNTPGGLSTNQKIFADEYLKDRNGTRAYKAAYSRIKSPEVAAAAASRLLTNVKVKAYLDKYLTQLTKKAGITTERVFREERRLAFSDLRQIFDGETTIPPGDLPDDIARAIAGVKVRTRNYGDGESETTYEYKLWDKGAALRRVESLLGMNAPAEVNVTGLEKVAELMAAGNKRVENG